MMNISQFGTLPIFIRSQFARKIAAVILIASRKNVTGGNNHFTFLIRITSDILKDKKGNLMATTQTKAMR